MVNLVVFDEVLNSSISGMSSPPARSCEASSSKVLFSFPLSGSTFLKVRRVRPEKEQEEEGGGEGRSSGYTSYIDCETHVHVHTQQILFIDVRKRVYNFLRCNYLYFESIFDTAFSCASYFSALIEQLEEETASCVRRGRSGRRQTVERGQAQSGP